MKIRINEVAEGVQLPNMKLHLREGLAGEFPCLDVFMGVDKGDSVRVWHLRPRWAHMFPAVRRPLCGHWFYAPRHSEAVLREEYGSGFETTCKTKVFVSPLAAHPT